MNILTVWCLSVNKYYEDLCKMFSTNKRVKYNYLHNIDSISITQFTLSFFNT